MKTIINNILSSIKSVHYKFDDEALIIKNKCNGCSMSISELIDITMELNKKNINYEVDEDENICIITD